MRRFLPRIILCLAPVIVSIAVVIWAYHQFENGRGGFRLGVDLAGGTILVYEVDAAKVPPDFKADDLANALKRRIDPNDLYNITIRPIAGTPPRVEIILPTGGVRQARAEKRNWTQLVNEVNTKWPAKDQDNPYGSVRQGEYGLLADAVVKDHPDVPTAEVAAFIEKRSGVSKDKRLLTGAQVEEIKNLIEKQGRLEFAILANQMDDQAAITAAEEYFKDPRHVEELKLANDRNDPPPAPRNRDDGTRFFPVALPNEPAHSYRWVELGKSELYSLHYNSAALAGPYRNLAPTIESARKSGQTFRAIALDRLGQPTTTMSGALLYSREISNPLRRSARDIQQGKKYEYFVLVREPLKGQEITGDYLSSAREGHDEKGRRAINFSFSGEGRNLFYEVTLKNKPVNKETGPYRYLSIIFDEQIMSAPSLLSPISGSGQITGEFTQQEVADVVRILRAGALPATLKKDPVSQNSMGATLGDDTIEWGTKSVLWAYIAVLAFMIFYYRFAGVVACVALFANLLLTVAFMVVVKAAFTLPGLAGLVLMLGMAVDANVLIYERLREERDRGATIAQALRNGYDRAFPTIIDTHLSSIFTAIVLYVVGNDQLKGFGISLTVGLLISLFTSLYMTRTMFEVFLAEGWLRDTPRFAGAEGPRFTHGSLVRSLIGGAIVAVLCGVFLLAWFSNWFMGSIDWAALNESKVSAAIFLVLLSVGTFLAIRYKWFDPTEGLHFVHIKFTLGGWKFDLHDPRIDFMAIRYYWFTATIILTILGGGIFFYRVWNKTVLNIDFVGGTAYTAQLSQPEGRDVLRTRLEGPPLPDTFSVPVTEKDREEVLKFVKARLGDDLKKAEVAPAGNEIVLSTQPMTLDEIRARLHGEGAPANLTVEVVQKEKGTFTPLPDLTIEQVFLSSDTGSKSRMFTVRTSEKDEKRVFKYVNDRMGDLLKKVNLDHYEISADGKEATLHFGRKVEGKLQPDYAAPSQIQAVLREEFSSRQLSTGLYHVEPVPETEKEEHYTALKVKLDSPLAAGEFDAILKGVQARLMETAAPERLENFDAQLAASTRERALYAILASWAAILLYLWFRFGSWTFGAAAVLCLIHDLFFTLGVIASAHYLYEYVAPLAWVLRVQDFKFDLNSVAALLTLVGYSVNDTIVVFDRIREVRGKNPSLTPKMINDSVNQTLSRTLLASMTVWVVVIVLYLFGGEGVKLFAFVMVVGVIVGTYSSIYIASPLLLIFGEGAHADDRTKVTQPAAQA